MKSLTALHATALAALLLASATVPAFAADLIVEVEGLRSNKGNVSVGLFDKAETFPKTFAVGQRVPANAHSGNVVEIVFRDLKPGSYALSAYQDENENQELDRGMFGIPKEPYGFSRDALGDKGPPEFRDARIELTEAGTRIRIKLR
ncbi:DUF2141 domain-containing protein [Uliginosibacterium sp. H1]|uniref:DUF2141 domain-containing protein n=1 Tax=Uliginosibacterium sp. H1 TaxID=3114757 RepID=UPI002E16DDDC|nr:DUF2141 domain-containing protein [Uliginosibacterium sp. H1]